MNIDDRRTSLDLFLDRAAVTVLIVIPGFLLVQTLFALNFMFNNACPGL